MKLRKNKNGKGYITSYTISIGSKEARDLKFIDENNESVELEKLVDIDNGTLTIKIQKK